uniref:Apolipoprotein B mRNA editing enzyme catalytic polypeptide-like 3Z1d isomer A n=1 Tax=Pteropus alecto TaxID=9402 RepID=A0A2R2Z4C6_PTEAL|nr:apolipoprotein B mRNA editing enzyme catalytic polypeptide-like 3Z1d isomer A [Pteropus alecto]
MEAGPAPEARLLMDKQTFFDNFSHLNCPRKTYLRYEVELLVGENSIPLDDYKDFLRNESSYRRWERCHAELIFLERMDSWNLDTELRYRVTCFISWSPCPDSADELVKFLTKNRHVNLRIFAARIYDYLQGYEAGLRALKAAGTDVAMMTFQEFEYCWKNFVDHQQDEDKPFPRWDNLDVESEELTKNLEGILQNQED